MTTPFPFKIPKNLQERIKAIIDPNDGDATGENWLIFLNRPWIFDKEYGTTWWVESKQEAIAAIKSAYKVDEKDWDKYDD